MLDSFASINNLIVGSIFLWLIILSLFFWRIYSHYRRLIGSLRQGDLINILDQQLSSMSETKSLLSAMKKRVLDLEKETTNNIKKVGLVRFNPYRELGGNQSFALSLLDEELNGVVLSALHNRQTTRVYAKPVVLGKETKYSLSDEEKEAVKIAKSLKHKK